MRKQLKIAIIAAGFKHQRLALEANQHLPQEEWLSELNVTQLVTSRKNPTPAQASALGEVLGKPADEIFPAMTGEIATAPAKCK